MNSAKKLGNSGYRVLFYINKMSDTKDVEGLFNKNLGLRQLTRSIDA